MSCIAIGRDRGRRRVETPGCKWKAQAGSSVHTFQQIDLSPSLHRVVFCADLSAVRRLEVVSWPRNRVSHLRLSNCQFMTMKMLKVSIYLASSMDLISPWNVARDSINGRVGGRTGDDVDSWWTRRGEDHVSRFYYISATRHSTRVLIWNSSNHIIVWHHPKTKLMV